METIKQNRNPLILILFEVAIGVLLLVDADAFANLIFMVVGVFFIVKAVQGIVTYFRTPAMDAAQGQGFAMALVSLVGGAFLAFQSEWIVGQLTPMLAAVFGAAILLTGFSKVQWSVDLLRLQNSRWYFPAVAAGVALVAGLLIVSGVLSVDWLLTFGAVMLVIGAVLDIVAIAMAVKGRPGRAPSLAADPAEAPAAIEGAPVDPDAAGAVEAATEEQPAETPGPAAGPDKKTRGRFGFLGRKRASKAEGAADAIAEEPLPVNEDEACVRTDLDAPSDRPAPLEGGDPARDMPGDDEQVAREDDATAQELPSAWTDGAAARTTAPDCDPWSNAGDAGDAAPVEETRQGYAVGEAIDAEEDLGPITYNGKPIE